MAEKTDSKCKMSTLSLFWYYPLVARLRCWWAHYWRQCRIYVCGIFEWLCKKRIQTRTYTYTQTSAHTPNHYPSNRFHLNENRKENKAKDKRHIQQEQWHSQHSSSCSCGCSSIDVGCCSSWVVMPSDKGPSFVLCSYFYVLLFTYISSIFFPFWLLFCSLIS